VRLFLPETLPLEMRVGKNWKKPGCLTPFHQVTPSLIWRGAQSGGTLDRKRSLSFMLIEPLVLERNMAMIQRPRNTRTLNSGKGFAYKSDKVFVYKCAFFFVLILFSVVLVGVIGTMLFEIGSVTTSGTVLYCASPPTQRCQPAVSFRTESGQQRTFVSRSYHQFMNPGDTVSVRYHPATPQDASEDPLPDLFMMLGMFGIFLTCAFMLLRYEGIPVPLLARLKRARNLLQHATRPRLSKLQSKESLKERREGVRRRTGAPKAVLVRLRKLNQHRQQGEKPV
jgi:hypothetical protein